MSVLKLFCEKFLDKLQQSDEWCNDCGKLCTLDEGELYNRMEYLEFLCKRCAKLYFGNKG